jgi:hypothetical protein
VNVSCSLIHVRQRARDSRREHDLAVRAVDEVAVGIDPDEVVVRPDLLHLPERIEERLVVPERHVLDRRGVALEVRPRERRIARELPFFHAIEAERVARRRDVVQIRRLAHCSFGPTTNRWITPKRR